jgi:excisionase family DNA binding protein
MGEAWRNDSGLVFTTPMGTPLDPENFGHTVPRICEAAGLGRWTLHELRHSCASLLIAMGVPLEVVSETLGHSSIRVTKDVYGHLLAPARAAAADAMARALWSTDDDNQEGDMATNLATRQELETTERPLKRGDVGRRGLEPGTSPVRAQSRFASDRTGVSRDSRVAWSDGSQSNVQRIRREAPKRLATDLLGQELSQTDLREQRHHLPAGSLPNGLDDAGPEQLEEGRMKKLLLTPEKTAEVMGIGRTKVYELLRAGIIDSVRIGACRRVPVAALHDYLDGLRDRRRG